MAMDDRSRGYIKRDRRAGIGPSLPHFIPLVGELPSPVLIGGVPHRLVYPVHFRLHLLELDVYVLEHRLVPGVVHDSLAVVLDVVEEEFGVLEPVGALHLRVRGFCEIEPDLEPLEERQAASAAHLLCDEDVLHRPEELGLHLVELLQVLFYEFLPFGGQPVHGDMMKMKVV
jgi:hypothetical protein